MKYPLVIYTLLASTIAIGAQTEKRRGDFWLDATLHFRLADEMSAPAASRPDPAVSADYAIKNSGDSSVAIKISTSKKKQRDPIILITPGPYVPSWALASEWSLQFEINQTGAPLANRCTLTLIDRAGKTAQSQPQLMNASAGWQKVKVALADFKRPAGFDLGAVTRVVLQTDGGTPDIIWLDAVRFTGPGDREIAITDQTTAQRMADDMETRDARIAEAFKAMTIGDKSNQNMFYYAVPARDKAQPNLQRLFAKLLLNEDLEQTNAELLAVYASSDKQVRANHGLEYTWDLLATPTLCRFYFNFGSKSTRYPGRLTPEVEKAILDLLWERTQYKNSIQVARENTWNMTGSENHDINAKVSNVLSSQIFMKEQSYAKRNYPNIGSGMGYGYWFHKTKTSGRFHGPESTAPRNYPGNFGPTDHYNAWVAFMKTYIRERAAKGFFIEKASPTYMRYTVGFLQDLYDYVADEELKQLTGMFLDLIWAEWAQDQIAGARGGAKTRDHRPLVNFETDAMYQMATYIFGGPSRNNPAMLSFWLTSYRPPAIVWNLALNRTALGCYAYISRTPGEEPRAAPRPAGMERTLITDTESRLMRYSWVTPDYILGTQMDSPLALHSHLSVAGRSHGMTFATRPDAMVAPHDIEINSKGEWQLGRNAVYKSMQQGPVMISQQAREYSSVSPEWFPNTNHDSRPYGLYFSPSLTRVEEDQGWIFVEEGNAYLAVRVVQGVYQYSVEAESSNYDWLDYQASEQMEEPLLAKPYTWNANKTMLRCADRHDPIIFEAGRRADYPNLSEFKQHILKNSVTLKKTTVPGWYILQYTTGATEYYFNATNSEISKVNGASLDFAPKYTFESPYIRGQYRSTTVTINDGYTRLGLDFEKTIRKEETLK